MVSSFYHPRWRIFSEYLKLTQPASYNAADLTGLLMNFDAEWQHEIRDEPEPNADVENLQKVLAAVRSRWPSVFGGR